MNKTVFAWTAPGSNYPAYFNISKNDDGDLVVIVRSPVSDDGACGSTSSATLPATLLPELMAAIGCA